MPIDMSAAKAPPRKNAGTPTRRASSVEPVMSITEKRAIGLQGVGAQIQGLALLTGQYADAAAIGQHFPPVATELAKMADEFPVIAGPIDFLIQVGPYTALLTAVMPLALQVAANHGWVDASRLYGQGVMPPAVLEAQMQAQMMQMQAEMIRAQQKAIREAQDAKEDLEKLLEDQKVAA